MKIYTLTMMIVIFLLTTIFCKNSLKKKDIQIDIMDRDPEDLVFKNNLEINEVKVPEKNIFENNLDTLKATSKAFMTIFLSGLFDKSFFITALMAMKFSNIIVISSATFSLSFIGIISVFLGLTINKYIPAIYIDFFSILLFFVFGAGMIYDGTQIKENSLNEEKHENEKDIEEDLHKNKIVPKVSNSNCICDSEKINLLVKEDIADITYCKKCDNEENDLSDSTKNNTEENESLDRSKVNSSKKDKTENEFLRNFQAFSKTFIMIFCGEIGDRSQISTIYLTANFDKFVVISAVISSSLILSILAVYGGVLISNRVSEKKLTIFAGFVFILFAVFAIVFIDKDDFNEINNLFNKIWKKDNFLKSN